MQTDGWTVEDDIRVVTESMQYRSDVPWPSIQRIIDAARAREATEYEYAWEADEAERMSKAPPRGPKYLIDGTFSTPEALADFPRGRRVRRRRAGAWEPVELPVY